ncbi:MAG: N-acetylglucosamine-6-phosphate deacetylase [Bacillaceae bacterium]
MAKKLIKNAVIYTGVNVIKNAFLLYDEKILEIGSMKNVPTVDEENVIDAEGKIIIPGMIDVHIHGGYTFDTMDGTSEILCKFSDALLQEGVTSFFPTTMTQSNENIEQALKACAEAKKLGANIEGIHVEGPFVSKKRAGAQPLDYIVKPDAERLKEWNKIADGLVKLITFAPEEADEAFMNVLKEENIVGSAGHTDDTFDGLEGKGITHYTHLYNQMRGLHHREPGVVGKALLDENAFVEIIPDGIHIHPAMVDLAYRLKGSDRVCVITDSMRAKGLEDGEYELGGQKVYVADKQARLEDGTLAGSVVTMDQAFRNIIAFTGCTIEDAVKMTSVNQAKQFGLKNKGTLEVGKDSDFVILDNTLHIEKVISKGKEAGEIK